MGGGPSVTFRINSRDGGKERGRLVQIMPLPLLKVNYLFVTYSGKVSEISGGKLKCTEGNILGRNEEHDVVLGQKSHNYINAPLLTRR